MVNIYDYIACPVCKGRLTQADGYVECQNHGRFPITPRGIPMLFSDSGKQVFDQGGAIYSDEKKAGRNRFIKSTLLRMPKLYFGDSLHDKLKKKYILDSPRNQVVLNFGSGHQKLFDQENFINFDIFPHGNAHVAGDGHELPFMNDSVDIVWLCAVLEHIRQPFQVMQEVYRVLKPGGYVLISVPFMQEQHGSPHDYFRFTVDGVRSICSQFDEIEAGNSYTGPFGTLVQITAAIPRVYFSNNTVRYGFKFVLSWLMSPLLLFDLVLNKSEETPIFGGACYLGEKPPNLSK